MTDRDRRQRRLLAVRALEADLAAAQLRTLHSRQGELRTDLAHWQGMMRIEGPGAADAHGEWLLGCAEGELAAQRAATVVADMEELDAAIAAQTAEERRHRVAREQMQRLCDSAAESARVTAERVEQGRLDDIFSAARLRRIAESAEAEASR